MMPIIKCLIGHQIPNQLLDFLLENSKEFPFCSFSGTQLVGGGIIYLSLLIDTVQVIFIVFGCGDQSVSLDAVACLMEAIIYNHRGWGFKIEKMVQSHFFNVLYFVFLSPSQRSLRGRMLNYPSSVCPSIHLHRA